MSIIVVGVQSDTSDTMYNKHKNVLMACYEAGITELPAETAAYFGTTTPDPNVMEEKLIVELQLTPYSDNFNIHGYELAKKNIPENVETIRILISNNITT